MDVGAVLIKLKTNRQTEVEAWQQEIERRKAEAIQTLQAEGVKVESWFQLELNDENYLLAYTRAKDIAQAKQMARNSSFEIDKVHQQFKQHWEQIIPAKLLIDLENNDEKETGYTSGQV
ncbi:hypothetical protein F909_01627 [Acinetobacter sp. ANC 3929]|uniref:DUF6176 family protein n=1 Tax=unclassified Acinetobacter TaxID=196816 RepID=UPI0002D0D29E|nr:MULTISPECIES: DUF6176 family protein [unclassified Acinetobacter]ENW81938.1 hypothetical protein F909_01627 [Acinetobacter sp. ANC 3929]MCH7352909.1 DUF6176 family protein [Acinetobacter sp. NIPH 2023]MCH7356802.1 DUF6176 family protein [Acinetobacter sp. NIPH 1958]MCH7360244.1 DUF6176 family protein [Acinetobacter sp. NIPH 2024]